MRQALAERCTQQAVALAAQLHAEDATGAHRKLLYEAQIAHARELTAHGFAKDAAAALESALKVATGPAERHQIALALAAAGQFQRALAVADELGEPALRALAIGAVADQALRLGRDGRRQLTDAWQGGLDQILQAFAQSEAGHDETAREILQSIGLQSPFLEWKLLLRGLLAYYAEDDARALDNWHRLSPQRLPARLVAPLRFQIDAAFRAACSPAVRRAAVELQGLRGAEVVRELQAALANRERLPEALRLAQKAAATLQESGPQWLPGLASCVYWAVVHHGRPEDVPRYQRTFGAPPDDPQLERMRALLYEGNDDLRKSHDHWRSFEQGLAQRPEAWNSEAEWRYARALVWSRMGHNAARVPDLDQLPNLPAFLRDHPGRLRPLSPGPEECFRRSLELAPERLQSYQDLFEHYDETDAPDKAEAIARKLLERFPGHAPTQAELSDLCLISGKVNEALGLMQQAAQSNPLDRRFRRKLARVHHLHAQLLIRAGRCEDAAADLRAALALGDQPNDAALLSTSAASEAKAGRAEQAEALLQQCRDAGATPLELSYRMLMAAVVLKLARAEKTRWEHAWEAELEAAPTAEAVVGLARAAAWPVVLGDKYVGQKTHQKKVLAYIRTARRVRFSREQLFALCRALQELGDSTQLEWFAGHGQRRFPRAADFYFLEAEAWISRGPAGCLTYRALSLLERAQELAAELPEPRRQELLEAIAARRRLVEPAGAAIDLGPFADLFESFFGDLGDLDPDDAKPKRSR